MITIDYLFFFFFTDTAPTEIYTLSLHDALPISRDATRVRLTQFFGGGIMNKLYLIIPRSEEHTSELQSRFDLVCRLLLEKKKTRANDPLDDYITQTATARNAHHGSRDDNQ